MSLNYPDDHFIDLDANPDLRRGFTGLGKLTDKIGYVYKGPFVNGAKHGKHGNEVNERFKEVVDGEWSQGILYDGTRKKTNEDGSVTHTIVKNGAIVDMYTTTAPEKNVLKEATERASAATKSVISSVRTLPAKTKRGIVIGTGAALAVSAAGLGVSQAITRSKANNEVVQIDEVRYELIGEMKKENPDIERLRKLIADAETRLATVDTPEERQHATMVVLLKKKAEKKVAEAEEPNENPRPTEQDNTLRRNTPRPEGGVPEPF